MQHPDIHSSDMSFHNAVDPYLLGIVQGGHGTALTRPV